MKLEEYMVKNKENHDILKKIISNAKSCIDKHGRTADNINTWSIKDITLLLRAYQLKNDKVILTKKKEVVDLCNTRKYRKPITYNRRVDVDLTILDNEDVPAATTADGTTLLEQLPPLPALQEVKVSVPLIAVVEHIDFVQTDTMM